MRKALIAAAGLLGASSMAVAIDKPEYDVAYEGQANMFVDSNDTYESREIVNVNDDYCFYLSGKLQKNEYPGRYPDTYLFMFDKQDNVVCEDDNSSSKGNGKASACYGVAPIPNGDDEKATVRRGVTGRPDGVDNMFNGLFFNAPHQQYGEAEVCVTYYDDGGAELDQDIYLCTFVTGAEAFRINYVVPEGTATVDVEIDNTTETFDICNDVDFYQLEGLEAACDYVVTVIGGVQYDCTPNCAILGWYNKNGELVLPVASLPMSDRGEGENYGQGAQLSVISDANGRIRFAVSGYGDEDFNGLDDEYQDEWENDGAAEARNVETPPVILPPVHDCCTCYTLKVEWNKHVDNGEPNGAPSDETMLLLSNGDLNTDGRVNVIDLAMMLNNWGWTAQ